MHELRIPITTELMERYTPKLGALVRVLRRLLDGTDLDVR